MADKISLINIKEPAFLGKASNSASSQKLKKTKTASDTFVKNKKNDAQNDGKFTFGEAFKNFAKGLISPLTAMVKHPFATLGVVLGTAALCFAVPVLTPILTVGFGALSVFENQVNACFLWACFSFILPS